MFFSVWVASIVLLVSNGVAVAQSSAFIDELNRPAAELLSGAQSHADAQHTPRLRVPRVVELANEVLVTVEVPLVGDDKHHIHRVALIDENSLVKLKYIATFSPQVRSVRITVPIKMAKTSQLKAVVECSLHGKWLGVSETIQVGAGGCAAGQEPTRKLIGDVLQLRFQESGTGIEASLVLRHPMFSGYTMSADNRITKSYDPFYLKSSRVLYKGQVLVEFELGPGLSENPRISVLLPRLGSEPLQAEAVSNTQQKFSLLARMP